MLRIFLVYFFLPVTCRPIKRCDDMPQALLIVGRISLPFSIKLRGSVNSETNVEGRLTNVELRI